jgi:tight adherence protein C
LTFIVVIGLVALVSASVVWFALSGVSNLFNPTRTAQDRLGELGSGRKDDSFIEEDEPEGGMEQLAERLGRLAKPSSEEEEGKLRQSLQHAGYRNRHATELFSGVRVGLALILPVLVLPISIKLSFTMGAGISLVMMALGYYVPMLLVQNNINKRQKRLLTAFPDSLDLLVSSVEAGLGLDAAFRRVAVEMESASPELAQEFQMVNHEISAGVSRVAALRHLAQRTGLDEVRSLVNMLTQAERFGTSVAKSLRIHSRVVRQKRMSKAEEEAAKVSPMLTVVMIIFLLPVLGMVLMGPAAITAYETIVGS